MLFIESLSNNGSNAMNVNGLAPNKTFSFIATSLTSIKYITCVLINPGSSPLGTNTGAFANGISFGVKFGNTLNQIKLIKTKSDLLSTFNTSPMGVTNPNMYMGTFMCDTGGLTLAPGNSVYAIVKDDLRGIEVLNMSCGFWKV